jgi:hypothetical protein
MSNANGVSEETHHKMSKKIAQLTKVIFHLHSKNEEHLQFSTSLTNTHEKEMEIILKEANEIIVKQKKEINKAKENSKLADKIKALENDHLQERKESQLEFEVYKQAMQEKEAHLEKQYRSKTEEMKVNLQEMKRKFDERCNEFKQQLLEFKNNNEAIEQLKKAHKIELQAHVQEHNKKYNELLQ